MPFLSNCGDLFKTTSLKKLKISNPIYKAIDHCDLYAVRSVSKLQPTHEDHKNSVSERITVRDAPRYARYGSAVPELPCQVT